MTDGFRPNKSYDIFDLLSLLEDFCWSCPAAHTVQVRASAMPDQAWHQKESASMGGLHFIPYDVSAPNAPIWQLIR